MKFLQSHGTTSSLHSRGRELLCCLLIRLAFQEILLGFWGCHPAITSEMWHWIDYNWHPVICAGLRELSLIIKAPGINDHQVRPASAGAGVERGLKGGPRFQHCPSTFRTMIPAAGPVLSQRRTLFLPAAVSSARLAETHLSVADCYCLHWEWYPWESEHPGTIRDCHIHPASNCAYWRSAAYNKNKEQCTCVLKNLFSFLCIQSVTSGTRWKQKLKNTVKQGKGHFCHRSTHPAVKSVDGRDVAWSINRSPGQHQDSWAHWFVASHICSLSKRIISCKIGCVFELILLFPLLDFAPALWHDTISFLHPHCSGRRGKEGEPYSSFPAGCTFTWGRENPAVSTNRVVTVCGCFPLCCGKWVGPLNSQRWFLHFGYFLFCNSMYRNKIFGSFAALFFFTSTVVWMFALPPNS